MRGKREERTSEMLRTRDDTLRVLKGLTFYCSNGSGSEPLFDVVTVCESIKEKLGERDCHKAIIIQA